MGIRTELAQQYRERSFNCAQSVLASFAQDYGLSEEAALRIATGFGAGMGRLCEVCGALTGAFMVVGLEHGRIGSDGRKDGPNTESTYAIVVDLARRFKERNGSIYCRELVGYDLSVPEEHEKARELGVFSTVCNKCVRDAVELLEETFQGGSE
jgi:C_GCAxxG_C_C family probable redox protein